jgi:phosphotransferase system enzyme I (PtsP)
MKKDAVDLICSVAELTSLFESKAGLGGFLQKVVSLVAYHMKAAVCSVYLYDENTQDLVLTANQGLNPDCVGTLRLKLGEGITGRALLELRAIREGHGSRNPFFKFIPTLHEEAYEAFLAVPILHGNRKVGVLVVQDPQPDYFEDNDVKALRAIAMQLASTIESAKLLMSLHAETPAAPARESALSLNRFIRGNSACEGIAMGLALSLSDGAVAGTDEDASTLDDFTRALRLTEEQLADLQRRLGEHMADVASLIFDAHVLMLKDDLFSGDMRRRIQQGQPAAAAIRAVSDHYVRLFARSGNEALREKVHDVRDLTRRLLTNLRDAPDQSADYRGRIVVAGDLLPSDLLKLAAQQAEGVVLIGGGVTAHVSVLARSLRIPMVILKEPPLSDADQGADTLLILDADQGNLMVNPTEEVRRHYRALIDGRRAAAQDADVLPATATGDGRRLKLMANINLLSELPVAQRMKAEGIGLYRSEFPFIVRNDIPSEEEQYRIYRKVLEAMPEQEVVLRTLDIGGDKMLSYYPASSENNPFLGLRAIRFSLRNRDMFSQQLRAMLRAGAGRPMSVMFPLISALDDFSQARDIVEACIEALREEALPCNAHPRLGAMIEVPSAVELAGDLAEEADFLCIGSNDLIQYTLAVDRTNETIADLYVPHHPAVLRSIKRVFDGAATHAKPVSLCGDMATDTHVLPVLIGIGIRNFSMEARQIPRVQAYVRGLRFDQARLLAEDVLRLGGTRAVDERLKAFHAARAGDSH